MGIKWCPEKKLEVILDFYDSDVSLVHFAESYNVSLPTIRKWKRLFEVFGFRGLCTDAEWNERRKLFSCDKFDLSELKCCNNYKLSKEVIDYISDKENFIV